MKVTGTQRNNGIGLEIPASYNFYHKKPSKIKKLVELLRDKRGYTESVDVSIVTVLASIMSC